MFSDTAEETSSLALTMGDLQLQIPRALSPSPPPQPLYQLKSASSTEQADFPENNNGFDFYSSPFDNSFPYRGILSNERTFSCSSPTSNASFLSETSFSNQPLLKNSQDGGLTSDSFGLLTTTSTPFHGNEIGSDMQSTMMNGGAVTTTDMELGNFFASQENPMNDSGLSSSAGLGSQKWDSPKTATSTSNNQFDFSFPFSESSINGGGSSNGSNASADSPCRLVNGNMSSLPYQWNSSDVSSLLDQQSPESNGSSSVITTSALGNSIWSPSQITSVGVMNNHANNIGSAPSLGGEHWDATLDGLSKKQLLSFVELLKEKYDECVREGNNARANQVQNAMVQVQQYIISSFVSESAGSICSVSSPTTTLSSPLLPSPTENSLDRVAKFHRDIAESKDAPYTWSGQLPPRIHRNPTYSCKVFLGGLPWDITESTLMQTFKPFGIMKIEWPGKEGISAKPKGYAYAVFENEKQVKVLLQSCTHDYSSSRSGNYYYKISSKKYRGKDVQIIPWALSDSNFVRCQASKIDPLKTVFVGALHGMVNAEGLATIMNDLFDNVIYAGIDTDRTKYPIGSARVTFNSTRSYMKAVSAAFVVIKTSRFEKKLQVDPYLEDATCSVCNLQQGPYFCRDSACFSYYCRTCFQQKHNSDGPYRHHRPMMRTTHNKQQQQSGSHGPYQASYVFGNGPNNNGNNGNNHHHQNHNFQSGNNYHHHNNQQQNGFGGHHNNRQWGNGGNFGGGRNAPTMNQLNAGSNLASFNGSLGGPSKFNGGNNNTVGGQCGGGNNQNGSNNGHGHGQLSLGNAANNGNGANRNFGQVGHRQQPNYMRW